MYRKDQFEKECPICGGKIWKGQKVLIEGTKMTVCQNCAQYGEKIISKTKTGIKKNIYRKSLPQSNKRSHSQSDELLDPSLEIVSNFAELIRNVRMKNNLNQDQFARKLNEKPSLIRRIETGKIEPSIKLAKKIEKMYDIKLFEKTDKIEINPKEYMKTTKGSSLGDIAFIKKKK